MCPLWNPERKYCTVSPSDSQCYRTDGEQQSHCLNSSNYMYCANYEAHQRGEYIVRR
jgi:hypothetical protein